MEGGSSSTVSFGQPVKHKIDWKTIIKDQAKKNYKPGVQATVLAFDPMPQKDIQKKIDKYFQPINYDQNRSKHMTFYD